MRRVDEYGRRLGAIRGRAPLRRRGGARRRHLVVHVAVGGDAALGLGADDDVRARAVRADEARVVLLQHLARALRASQ